MSIGNKARPTSSELKKPGSVVVGRKQSAIATPIKYEAAQIPVPKASSINYDLEKAMQKNPENDKVGVIVEIPERSMREMLPVILTFFCILTCLVPIDIFLALSVMNYKDPVPQQVTQAITSSESQVEAHLLKKRSYDLEALGADSNKNVSTSPENWCERSAEISSNVFTITYDLGKVQRFLDRPLIYAMVYSIKLTIRVPLAVLRSGSYVNAFILPQTIPPEAYVFNLTNYELNAQTLRFTKLESFDASNLTKSFLSYSSLERLGHFDLVSLNEGFTFYKLYTVNFVMDFGFRRLRIETCGRPHQCKVQHDKHITVANDSSGSVLAIRVVNQLNDVTVHADGNYARIEDRVCCQVYLKTSYLKRTKLCQTNNTSEDIVCNDATTDPACRSYVQ
ncbi:uncharacterized protein LOC111251230 isoform X1 [Varroa destructor]|uniref:Uncharacterized protein n=2 Tax=Varroa destructor TaxID=109461 RepID=A0A7M7K8W7_VARDE|nr:uncharacterized protein LOC111251230 isoform X1 [Varroa destructor]